MRTPADLMARFSKQGIPDGTLMFCGTLAVHRSGAAAERFEFELDDPVLKRKIAHGYDIISLQNFG